VGQLLREFSATYNGERKAMPLDAQSGLLSERAPRVSSARPPVILAVDTTSEHGGAGLYRGSECLAIVASTEPAHYAVSLFHLVNELLARAGLALSQVDAFAVADGPGSFTGIRVGIAAVQGWACAFGRPVYGVSVLQAMADEAGLKTPLAISLLDARRGEFFAGLFRRDPSGNYEADGDALVLKPDALRNWLDQLNTGPETQATLVRRAHDAAAQAFCQSLDGAAGSFHLQTVEGLLVRAMAQRAQRALAAGKLLSPAELHARYVRRSDAELRWKG
jgi:tRNA threonylcarbamoyladenosine biosynthesis protein TsaB